MTDNLIRFPKQQTSPEQKRRRNLRSDGRYCVRVTVRNPDGTDKRVPFYSYKSLSDAKAQAKAYKDKIKRGLSPDDIEMTVSEWAGRWLPGQIGKSMKTNETYARATAIIVEAIGAVRIREVRKMHLDKIMQDAQVMSKSYIAKLRMTMKALFADADQNDLVDKNPAAYIRAVGGTYRGHRALEDWEMALILNHWQARRAGFWMLLMMLSGMRKGEAIARSGADADKNIVFIQDAVHAEGNQMVNSGTTKTAAGVRAVPIFDPLLTAIKDKNFDNDKPMMASATGKPLTKMAYRCGWDSALLAFEKIANGWPIDRPTPRLKKRPENWIRLHWTAHDLRYTYATILYDAGVDEKTAQVLMGHKDPKMTRDLYAQLSLRRKKLSTAALSQYMERLAETVKSEKRQSKSDTLPDTFCKMAHTMPNLDNSNDR